MNGIFTEKMIAELTRIGENLTFDLRDVADLPNLRVAFNTDSITCTKETETMTTEDQLLDVIASAQERLSAIRRLPREEPHSNDETLIYRFHVEGERSRRNRDVNGFTYAALRIPGDVGLRSWYITSRAIVKNPMTWNELVNFMTSRGVTTFESLYTKDEWTNLHVERTGDVTEFGE